MEIRPYKSQVKSTPVISAAQETPDLTKGARLKTYGNIITESGKTAEQAISTYQRVQMTNQLLGEQAAVQDIDLAIEDGLKEFQRYLDERSKDPNGVFYDDNKAADEVYSYQMIKAKENTVGRIKDPGLRAKAEEYFNQLKLRAGADVEQMIEQHKARAGAVVLGNAIARDEERAINAQSQDEINGYLGNIVKSLSDMSSLKAITPEQSQQIYEQSKRNINFGRARNQIDALFDANEYKAAQEFINNVDIDDESRKKLQEYYKDNLSRYKSIREHELGESYEDWMKAIADGTATREGIMADRRLELHPELDMRTDYRKIFIGILDARDKAQKEKEEAEAKAQKGSAGGTGKGAGGGTDGHMAEFYSIVLNPYASLPEKQRQAAEFYRMYPEAVSDLSKFNTMIQTSDKYANVQIKALQEDVDARIKALAGQPEQAMSLIKASQSLFQVLAEDMWYKTVDGRKVETSEVERKEILDRAVEQVGILLKETDVLSILAGFSASGNPAKFKATGDGYRMDIDSQYDDLKSVLKGAEFYRNTDEGQRLLIQLETTEKEAIQNATGEYIGNYAFKVVDGKAYYVSPAKDKIYYIDENAKGRWNIYVDTGKGAETVIPQIIQREQDLPAKTPGNPAKPAQRKKTPEEIKQIEQAWENSPDWWKNNPMVRWEYEHRND